MRPAIARPTTPPRGAIHDDRRVGGSPPGRTMRGAAHPSHSGRGGGDAPASWPGRPGRSGAGTIRPGPSPGGRRATGPAAAMIADHAERDHDPAPGRPRVDPAAAAGLLRDSSRNPTMTAAGSSPRRVVEDLGRFRRAQQPDSDASTHRRMDWTGRSPPPRRMRRCPALTRTPGRRRPPLLPGTRSPCGSPGAPPSDVRSRRAPPRSRHQRRGRGAPRRPATRSPTARATGPYDPATPATGPDSRTVPRTTCPSNPAPHPGADTIQPHLTLTFTHRPKNTKHSSTRRGSVVGRLWRPSRARTRRCWPTGSCTRGRTRGARPRR